MKKTLVASTALAALVAVLVGCPPKSTPTPPAPPVANPAPPQNDAPATKPPEPAASTAAPANPAPSPSPAAPATDAGSSDASKTAGPTGSIEGRVTVNRAVTPPAPFAIDKDPDACGKTYDPASLTLSSAKGLANAVVYLKGELPAWKPGAGETFTIDQKGCHYAPRISIVPVGTPVEFLNSDAVLHNVSWNSPFNGAQNLAIPPHEKMKWTFKQKDFIGMSCGVHPFMGGALVVAEHRWYVLTDADGKFSLANVPAGSYKLVVWHETLKKAVNAGTPVTVEAGKTAQANVSYD